MHFSLTDCGVSRTGSAPLTPVIVSGLLTTYVSFMWVLTLPSRALLQLTGKYSSHGLRSLATDVYLTSPSALASLRS
ncbi:hypothetical protein FA13DRAFT_243433 [Coprinellus micaceus]|uniref:Uncharacterized protein n=1 Tax=Coprinellus micaceus TaxID=71717 RepID=A0A4Y7SEN8_COPMI|nr:hypothetical protein FA13DRAFT_243433 [Coprinellus micaceus]